MLYPIAMLALVALNTVPPAPTFFSRALEAKGLLHHVAGRPRGGIGNTSKGESQEQGEAATSGDPGRPIGALLTEKHLNELFPGNSPFGVNVYEGSGPFREYYAPDGSIRGHDEKANWAIEGDTICMEYESEGQNCFSVRRLADATYALESDGRVDGYFKVAEGNPFEF